MFGDISHPKKGGLSEITFPSPHATGGGTRYKSIMGSIANPLTEREEVLLDKCEQIIEGGLKAFVEVGNALIEVRDQRLYRAEYHTFEEYLDKRWHISRPRGYQLIGAAQVVNNLSTNGIQIPPETERQARELVGLDPLEQHLVWGIVQQTAPNNQITAQHIKSVVKVLGEVMQTGALDPGTGEQVPIVSPAFKAAITEETYERMQRQQAHIADRLDRPIRLHADTYKIALLRDVENWLELFELDNLDSDTEVTIVVTTRPKEMTNHAK